MLNYNVMEKDIIDDLYMKFTDTERVPETQRAAIEEGNLQEVLRDLREYLPYNMVDTIESFISDYGRAYLHMGFRGGFNVAKEILK